MDRDRDHIEGEEGLSHILSEMVFPHDHQLLQADHMRDVMTNDGIDTITKGIEEIEEIVRDRDTRIVISIHTYRAMGIKAIEGGKRVIMEVIGEIIDVSPRDGEVVVLIIEDEVDKIYLIHYMTI